MPFIISTITNDTVYPLWEQGGADLQKIKRQLLIKGGANRGGKHLHTPHGIATNVTDEELEFLKNHEAFNRHVKKGFLTFVETKKAPDADKMAESMAPADGSAPLSEDDYKKGGRQFGRGVEVPTSGDVTKVSKKRIKED